MQFEQLGNTGVFVSRLCLGAMTFGGAGKSGSPGPKESLTAYGAPLGYAAGMARPAWPGG